MNHFSMPVCIQVTLTTLSRLFLKTFIWACLFAALNMSVPLSVEKVRASDKAVLNINGVWCRKVAGREPVKPYFENRTSVSVSDLLKSGLCFWTLIKGGENELRILHDQKMLKIRHVWNYENFLVVRKNTIIIPRKSGKLGSGTLSAMDWELKAKGFFDWRGWSYRTVYPGKWSIQVEVLQPDNVLVTCDNQEEQSEKCEYTITAR